MPNAKYKHIYRDLKEKIENEYYAYQEMLPSEHTLVEQYGCSRNTVRRALAGLSAEGRTKIRPSRYVERGYEHIEEDLTALGGKIRKAVQE